MWSFSSTSTTFWRTIWKLSWYFLNFLGFLVVISASQRVIKSSNSSPASNTKRRTAESVTISSAMMIGRELIFTIFCTYFILSFSGIRKRLKRWYTILLPTNSCPWNVQPIFLSKRLVGALPMSCNNAAHRSHKLSVCSEILSTTSKVCQKLSLWRCPSCSCTPCSAISSGRI